MLRTTRARVAGILVAAGIFGCVSSCGQDDAGPPPIPSPPRSPATTTVAVDTTSKFGQTIYVPVYSHVAVGDRAQPYALAITLSARNTDSSQRITILSARYFDGAGKMVRNFVMQPVELGPMAAFDFFVEESNEDAGSAASFLVEWVAGTPTSDPIVEAVMVGTRNQQGVSFTSTGRVLNDRRQTGSPTP